MRRAQIWIACLLALCPLLAAALAGGDATWDLRNYHLYNPFAFFNKEPGVDIAPAHMQTWFPPMQDLLYYELARAVPVTSPLNVLLAVPNAVAMVLAFVLTSRLIGARTATELAAAGLAVVIGATGAASGSTIATTMSEMLPGSLFLGALLLLLPGDPSSPPGGRRVLLAGLLAGAACGFKLTFTYAAASLAASLVLMPPLQLRPWLQRVAFLGLGGAAGALAIAGYWWALQIHLYGNPLFPMYNDLVHSPLVGRYRYVDPAFLPHSARQAFEAPWAWALTLYRGVSESRLRDPRFAIGVLAALALLGGAALPRRILPLADRRWPALFLALFFLLSFALWRVQFSVLRYLSVLELLIGTLLLLLALPYIRRLGAVLPALGGLVLLLAGLWLVTVYPYVERASGPRPWDVDLGPLGNGAMVLLLDNAPAAYLAAFADPRTRFVATNDYFMTLDDTNPMQASVEAAIAGHRGPLWGVDSPDDQGDRSEAALARYGLTRGACRPVRSNLSPEPIRICALLKNGALSSSGT